MKTCAFITLGCKVNQYETQAIRESLAARGFMEISPDHAADFYIINTCTITSVSDERSRQYIRKVRRKNPSSTVVVTGCYAEADTETLKKIVGVDFVITKAEEPRLAEIISMGTEWRAPASTISLLDKDDEKSIYNLKISRFKGHTRAFLKIEDGCDVYCSYCIIPYVRGEIKSRELEEIEDEAGRLIDNGYKEIVLTGIHLGAYGRDTNRERGLIDVIEMLIDLPGLERLRLSSIEVNEITDDLINLVAGSNKICPHFHIPLQSGDDFILKRMNRKYTAFQYMKTLDRIHSKIVMPSFTTDVMVGFPGEKNEHFENTINVSKKAGFSRIHIFPFSVRKGTPASKMHEHCASQVIKQRKKELEGIAEGLAVSYKKHFLNKYVDVLVETERDGKTNKLCGYSERYMKALFDGPDDIKNTIVSVLIKDVNPSFVVGILK
ncbi:MAG TPA: tRNA (N(6)-L-threonylcarbamoyladenosine(37)-C(2))-methylthiotransferase MtaB [Candidatus Wujingus californicus]|uniref:tRNA (N(6)-L-threonylcarbamoyladenosine(37)-C(2))- methylthiotransferase MtaB n=1 Tax=Candidatus Wujingus californicus TaxID=3367618 RepID=UPI001D2D26EC|nr:tRNA (N(6)-L-threonylcarbamoyladenosine(37)-C(2))-methylthiotransferase MtaB [Planctomycetota bacterium]